MFAIFFPINALLHKAMFFWVKNILQVTQCNVIILQTSIVTEEAITYNLKHRCVVCYL